MADDTASPTPPSADEHSYRAILTQHPTGRFLGQMALVLTIVNVCYFVLSQASPIPNTAIIGVWEKLALAVNILLPVMIFGVVWGQYRRWRALMSSPKTTDTSTVQRQTSNTSTDKASVLVVMGQWLVLFLCVIIAAFTLSVLFLETASALRYGVLTGISLILTASAVGYTREISLIKHERNKNDTGNQQTSQPKTQQKDDNELPQWIRQLPLKPIEKRDEYVYIKSHERERILQEFRANHGKSSHITKEDMDKAIERLDRDIAFLQEHLIDKFRKRDYDAKSNQARYRRYQIGYMVLAALAGIFGSLLALNLNEPANRGWVTLFGFLETLVALGTAYLATITGKESPLQEWLTNRQKAEALRREYQRYIVNLPPYQGLNEIRRQRMLKMRVAAINLLGTPDANEAEIKDALSRAGEQPDPNANPTHDTPVDNGGDV